jgi:lysine-ketoglutarate reductase/saccharopine dehydrogenase-like protein (TIGR00300 family)
MFTMPIFQPPDFTRDGFTGAPEVTFKTVQVPGVAPENYHGTSVYPEYFKIGGEWHLLTESRMDCVVTLSGDTALEVVEFRRLQPGDRVACGRIENGEEGIFVHTEAFSGGAASEAEKFAFRSNRTRETSFSIDYDELYALLQHERQEGNVLWVLGPAVVFDHDARQAFCDLIRGGFVNGLMAGNALATHDIEGAIFKTALGQELYSKQPAVQGHYKHLDALNHIRNAGSIKAAIDRRVITDGVMKTLMECDIPYVLAGSIRDDGPLPEVIANVYQAQDAMRALTRRATTIIALATQLHTIATGNMAPSYQVMRNGEVRPVYFYSVDMSEFAVNKLSDRGSLTARSILTNVQDFVVTLRRGVLPE